MAAGVSAPTFLARVIVQVVAGAAEACAPLGDPDGNAHVADHGQENDDAEINVKRNLGYKARAEARGRIVRQGWLDTELWVKETHRKVDHADANVEERGQNVEEHRGEEVLNGRRAAVNDAEHLARLAMQVVPQREPAPHQTARVPAPASGSLPRRDGPTATYWCMCANVDTEISCRVYCSTGIHRYARMLLITPMLPLAPCSQRSRT